MFFFNGEDNIEPITEYLVTKVYYIYDNVNEDKKFERNPNLTIEIIVAEMKDTK